MGSLVACPFRSRAAPSAASTADDDFEDDEDEEDDVVRIPIEIRPRGRLGIKSARSWGRGGGHSANSLDLEHPEMERARREWAFSIQSRDQELSKLRGRLEALELRHRRVCTELKALQRTCASLKRERHQALVAEQQALARAKLFLGERDRLKHQVALLSEASATTAAAAAKASNSEKVPVVDPLKAARCLLDVDLDAVPPLALLERFVGENWRLDSFNAFDGVVRLAVAAATFEESAWEALTAAAAPFELHAIHLPPSSELAPPHGFEVVPLESCADTCHRRVAQRTATCAASPLSRLWRPPELRRALAEERHALASELQTIGDEELTLEPLVAHLAASTSQPALRISVSERPAFLHWLRDRLNRPGVFYFGASGACPLLLLRQFLADHLTTTAALLPPVASREALLGDIFGILAKASAPSQPLAVVLDGASVELCSEALPPCVKLFLLEKVDEKEEAELEDSPDVRELLSAILDGASLPRHLWRHSEVVCRLLGRRFLRTSYRGVEFCSAAAITATYRLLGRQNVTTTPPPDLCYPAELPAEVTPTTEGLAASAFVARCLCAAGEAAKAVALLSRCWERLEAELEPEDGRLGWCLAQLAVAMEMAGRGGDARRLRRQLATNWEALSWTEEERRVRLEALWPACGAEAALLGAVAKDWSRLTTEMALKLEESAPKEAMLAWQAVALAYAALGRQDDSVLAIGKALKAAVIIGDEDSTAGVRSYL